MLAFKYNVLYSVIGNALFSLGMWLNISVIAKLGSVEAVGDYALANAIISPLFGLFSLNIRAAVATDVRGQFEYEAYFATRIVTSIICTVVIIIITFFLERNYEIWATMIVLTVAKLTESFCDIRSALLLKLNNMKPVAISLGLRGIGGVLSLAFGLLVSGSLPVGLACLATSWIAVYYCYDRQITNTQLGQQQISTEYSSVKTIIWLCLPLGVLLLINMSINNIPRYFVSSWLDQRALGYFAATTYFIFLGSIFVNALALPLHQSFSKCFDNDIQRFKLMLVQGLGVALLLGVCGVLIAIYCGESILTLAYTKEYAEYSYLLIWTMIASVALYCSVMMGTAITATRKFKSQMLANLPIPIITLLFLLAAHGSFTLVTAAQAILVAYCTKLVVQTGLIAYLVLEREKSLSGNLLP
ncbi:MAG: hypothetical protein OEU68_01445 [Nitrospira sp.]|nr:hypothetical protein [Nitrospira sp.]MDH4242732.1 hypothetical protein [Nitrospira sp.]MDH4354941.1 hypothetical protein [Nitrospira sp.]MDH5317248.1 hypothetical protein [Nitrospira sp.]